MTLNDNDVMSMNLPMLVFLCFLALIAVLPLISIKRRFIKVPPNRLLLIYGKVQGGVGHIVVKNGSAFVWPVIQDYVWISTEPFKIVFPNGEKLIVHISRDEPLVNQAAERLLGLKEAEIIDLVRDHLLQAGPQGDRDRALAKLGLVRSDS